MKQSIFIGYLNLLLVLAVGLTTRCERLTAGSSGEAQLVRKTYHSKSIGKDRDYWLCLPKGHGSAQQKTWPVILFLHGGGERGDDIQKVMVHGPLMEAAEKGRDLPFIMIAPQMPQMPQDEERPSRGGNRQTKQAPKRQPMIRSSSGEATRWGESGPPHGWWEIEDDLIQLVNDTIKEYSGDPDRVYITGLSYGGFGTWHMISKFPQMWAAAAPICGAGDLKAVSNIGSLPVWVFQGGRDTVVLPEWTIATADALDAAGGNVRVTVHEDLKHNVWVRVYEGRDLYDWFLSHKRGEPAETR